MNLRWDVLAWNRLNSAIYRDYSTVPPEERNLLEILFKKLDVLPEGEEENSPAEREWSSRSGM